MGDTNTNTSIRRYESHGMAVDPGKKSIVTMVNKNGVSLRYTTRQRNFESGLKRYREVLEKEKEIHRIHEVSTYYVHAHNSFLHIIRRHLIFSLKPYGTSYQVHVLSNS